MPRRFRINGPLLLGILAFAGGIGLYIIFPLLPVAPPHSASGLAASTIVVPTHEILRERAITCVTGLWFFVFGTTIGSFLNVVAYRMPMGLSFIAKPSRCPYCETPILFRHNVPIFGWLALRGRCHACRLPISIRYLLIEVIVGGLFFLLFVQELASGGANLPWQTSRIRPGVMWNVLSPNWPLIGLYFFHTFLIGVLATIALMKWDQFRIPAKLVVFTVAVSALFRFLFPPLTVQSWWLPFAAPQTLSVPWQQVVGLGVDLVVGVLIGWATAIVMESQRPRRSSSSTTGSLACGAVTGTLLGWQVLVPVLLLAVIAQFFSTLVANMYQRASNRLWAASYLVSTVIVISLWKYLPTLGLPSANSPLTTHWRWLLLSLASVYVTASLSSQEGEVASL